MYFNDYFNLLHAYNYTISKFSVVRTVASNLTTRGLRKFCSGIYGHWQNPGGSGAKLPEAGDK